MWQKKARYIKDVEALSWDFTRFFADGPIVPAGQPRSSHIIKVKIGDVIKQSAG
jgi:hypothetical protein